MIDLDDLRATLSPLWADHGVRHGRDVLALLARWAGEPDPIDTYTVLTRTASTGTFSGPWTGS